MSRRGPIWGVCWPRRATRNWPLRPLKERSPITANIPTCIITWPARSTNWAGATRPKSTGGLFYLDDGHNKVRITGAAEVVTDRSALEEIWNANPLLRQYLGTIDNPELIVYRIRPAGVRYMQEWALEYYEVPVSGADL